MLIDLILAIAAPVIFFASICFCFYFFWKRSWMKFCLTFLVLVLFLFILSEYSKLSLTISVINSALNLRG